MSTGRTERRWEGDSAALALTLVLLLSGLAGCSADTDDGPQVQRSTTPAALDTEVGALLHRRARSLRSGDLPAFLADVDDARPRFRARQERLFLNLRELPIGTFGYVLQGNPVTLSDGRVQAVVEQRLLLAGYDAAAVRTRALFTFRRNEDGQWRLAEDRDREFERENDIEPQPWDLTRIEVERGDGVLGIFDDRSVDAAYQIIASVEDGIDEVTREVPVPWRRRVVVYALSDLTVLASLDNLPGGDPDRLDGVAFPVRVAEGAQRLAGIRFMLHPRMIYRNDGTRSRLIRHELTHVALGRRDDNVPTWLAEGIAEYVSVQAIPADQRMISRQALEVAQTEPTSLPRDRRFNGPHSGANYGLAWYACEYVVDAFGEETLWRLFDAMRGGGGTSEDEQDAVLLDVLGMDSAELARVSARSIVDTFG